MHELHLLERHLEAIACREEHVLHAARAGRILRSIAGIGTPAAAALRAAIGNIENFPSAAALKAYFGWAPALRQSGVAGTSTTLSRAGERSMKAMMYLVAMQAIQDPGPWADLYQRLVERGCSYDERRREYLGKKRIVGRIAGQMLALLYGVLRADVDLRARTPAHEPLPAPLLSDATTHHAQQTGAYHARSEERASAASASCATGAASGASPGARSSANTAALRSRSRRDLPQSDQRGPGAQVQWRLVWILLLSGVGAL